MLIVREISRSDHFVMGYMQNCVHSILDTTVYLAGVTQDQLWDLSVLLEIVNSLYGTRNYPVLGSVAQVCAYVSSLTL